jgi:hypothetical protein
MICVSMVIIRRDENISRGKYEKLEMAGLAVIRLSEYRKAQEGAV